MKAIFEKNANSNLTKIGVTSRNQAKTTTSGKAGTGSVRDSVESLYTDMQSDFNALQTNVSIVNIRINDIFTVLRNLSDRVDILEGCDQSQSLLNDDLEARLSKQEFFHSELERKARTNDILLTHPDLNASNANINKHVAAFIQRKFQLPLAKLNGLTARKIGPDIHTLLISFPNEKTVGELFKIKKELRSENKDDDLFLNEFLTTYNYNLLKSLKSIMAVCRKKKQPEIIYSTFSFRGRIYVKKTKDSDRILIKDKSDIKKLFQS